MNKIQTQPTLSFWIISILATLWNLVGVLVYLGQAYMTDDVLTSLPEPEQLYYANRPAWVVAAFAIAVFAGFFGSIGLLRRKKRAFYLFVISFIALMVQTFHSFFVQNHIKFEGTKIILPMLTVIIALFLIYFSNAKAKSGVLN